jgi:signal transduction histidine kinase
LANEGAILDREAMSEITSDLAELEHLIAEVLTTARLSLAQGQAGDVLARLPKSPVDAATIVDATAERFRKSHPHIDLQVHSEGGLTVVVAETLVRRALDNLLDNAAGHGAGAAVTLTLRVQADMATFEVRDLGPGMRPEDAERVFEPFFRADPSRTKVGGLGLGLTLVRRVAEAHGGTATLESSLGQGTVVCVTLPIASAGIGKEPA